MAPHWGPPKEQGNACPNIGDKGAIKFSNIFVANTLLLYGGQQYACMCLGSKAISHICTGVLYCTAARLILPTVHSATDISPDLLSGVMLVWTLGLPKSV
jgi:hypothetical protein